MRLITTIATFCLGASASRGWFRGVVDDFLPVRTRVSARDRLPARREELQTLETPTSVTQLTDSELSHLAEMITQKMMLRMAKYLVLKGRDTTVATATATGAPSFAATEAIPKLGTDLALTTSIPLAPQPAIGAVKEFLSVKLAPAKSQSMNSKGLSLGPNTLVPVDLENAMK